MACCHSSVLSFSFSQRACAGKRVFVSAAGLDISGWHDMLMLMWGGVLKFVKLTECLSVPGFRESPRMVSVSPRVLPFSAAPKTSLCNDLQECLGRSSEEGLEGLWICTQRFL